MVDRMSKEKRSKLMSKIRGKNNKIEVALRKTLWKRKLRGFRIHYNLPGKPDVVFPKHKLAVFCDGEFWHGYNFIKWKKKLSPFWLQKITANIARDRKNDGLLEKDGWDVIHFWGRRIIKNPDFVVNKIRLELKKRNE